MAHLSDGVTHSQQSRIWRWNAEAECVDALHECVVPTVGAYDWESFESGASTYLAVAEYQDGGDYHQQVRIFRWDAQAECVVQPAVAEIETVGA